jgi:hypothetical protein
MTVTVRGQCSRFLENSCTPFVLHLCPEIIFCPLGMKYVFLFCGFSMISNIYQHDLCEKWLALNWNWEQFYDSCVCFQFPLLDKRHGVRILCMCPGATDTPILTGILDTFETLDVGREEMSRITTQQWVFYLPYMHRQNPAQVASTLVTTQLPNYHYFNFLGGR